MKKTNSRVVSASLSKINTQVRELRLELQLSKDKLKNIEDRKRRIEKENIHLEADNEQLKKLHDQYMKDRENITKDIERLKGEHTRLDKELGFRVLDVESREASARKQQDINKRQAVANAKEMDKVNALAQDTDIKIKSIEFRERKALAEQESANVLTRSASLRDNESKKREIDLDVALSRAEKLAKEYEYKIDLLNKDRESLAAEIKSYRKKTKDVEKESSEILTIQANLKIKTDEATKEKDKAIQRQKALDNNLSELRNEVNRIEIVRLKVVKLINDYKDIKELEALRKEVLTNNLSEDISSKTKEP